MGYSVPPAKGREEANLAIPQVALLEEGGWVPELCSSEGGLGQRGETAMWDLQTLLTTHPLPAWFSKAWQHFKVELQKAQRRGRGSNHGWHRAGDLASLGSKI